MNLHDEAKKLVARRQQLLTEERIYESKLELARRELDDIDKRLIEISKLLSDGG